MVRKAAKLGFKLDRHDRVVTAWAERCNGPGWSNSPVWLLIRSDLDGSLRQECLQPTEQSADILLLYGTSAASHSAMTAAVRAVLKAK